MNLLMMVPSRGRPANVAALAESVRETSTGDTLTLYMVDNNDPYLLDYMGPAGEDRYDLHVGPPQRIGPYLNTVAAHYLDDFTHIGFMGDDHRPRTKGWDETLCTDGVAYGNDLIQGESLPTAVVMDARIVRAMGYFVPPGQKHLFLDNAWKTWGQRTGRLRYFNDVIIEHMHPIAGKATWDEGYSANNSGETWEADEKSWNKYCATQLDVDLKKIREALV